MISTLVLVGLGLVWAVVLLPDLVARISRVRKADTIRTFNHQLSSLGRSAPVDRRDARPTSGGAGAVLRRGSVGRPSMGRSSMGDVIDLRSRLRARTGAQTARTAPVAVPEVTATNLAGAPRPVSAGLRKRRQDVLFGLGAAALLTLLATVAFGGVFLYLHLFADVLMACYLVALQRVGATRPAASRPAAPIAPRPLEFTADAARSGELQPRRIAN